MDSLITVASARARLFQTDHLRIDLRGKSVRGGAVTILGQCTNFVLQIAATAVLGRILVPSDFGLIAMVATVTGFTATFRDLGLSQATIQRADITEQQVSNLFWVNVALSVVLAMIVAVCAPLVASFYGQPELMWITVVLGGTFVLSGLAAQHTALLRRQMRFSPLVVVDCVAKAISILVAIALAVSGARYWALVSMIVVDSGCTTIGTWAVVNWIPQLPRRKSGVGAMLRFGGNLTGFNTLNYITRNFDNVLIGSQLGAASLGVYSRAYNLLMMPIRQINGPIGAVTLPALSRLQGDPAAFRRYYLRAIEAAAVFGMPIITFALVEADHLVGLILGPHWIEVASVFRWLGPAAFLGTLNVAPGWLCSSLGRANRQLHWALVTAPVTAVAFVIGLRWGVVGVAGAFSASWCALLLAFIWYACWRSPVSVQDIGVTVWRPAFASVISCTATAGLDSVLRADTQVRLGLDVIVFALVYLSFLRAIPGGKTFIHDFAVTLKHLRRNPGK